MKLIGVTTGLALVASGLMVAPAFSAEPEEVSALLVEHTLTDLGVDGVDADLASALEDSIESALEAGVLSEAVVLNAEAIIDDGATDAELSDAVLENLASQEAEWVEQGEVYREAFQSVAEEFNACRDSTEGCSAEFSQRVRASWVVAETTRIEALSARLDTLEGTAREQVQAQIQARTQRLEQRSTSQGSAPGNSVNRPQNSQNGGNAGSQDSPSRGNSGSSGSNGNGGNSIGGENPGNSGSGNGNSGGNGGESNGGGQSGSDNGNSGNGNSGNGKSDRDRGNSGNGNSGNDNGNQGRGNGQG